MSLKLYNISVRTSRETILPGVYIYIILGIKI